MIKNNNCEKEKEKREKESLFLFKIFYNQSNNQSLFLLFFSIKPHIVFFYQPQSLFYFLIFWFVKNKIKWNEKNDFYLPPTTKTSSHLITSYLISFHLISNLSNKNNKNLITHLISIPFSFFGSLSSSTI